MNILHLTTYLQGGAGRIIHDLALAQRRSGDRVTVVTSKTAYPGYCNYREYLEALRNAGIELIEVDSLFRREQTLIDQATARIGAQLLTGSYDLIHSHSGTPSEVALHLLAKLQLAVPIVQTMHGWGNSKTPEQERQNQDTLNRVTAVATLSVSNQRLLESKGVRPSQITIIPCGIKDSPSPPITSDQWRRVKALANEKRIIGCIGSLCQRKNQRLLIESLPHIKMNLPKVALVFIGEGDIETELRQYAEKMGVGNDTLFLGYQPQADSFIPLFDILCLPSRAEGLPISILEGLRDQTPVVASDIPELSGIIRNKSNGRLFETENPKSLANVITEALSWSSEERQSITTTARADFDRLYSQDTMVAAYRSLYEEAINKASKIASGHPTSDS